MKDDLKPWTKIIISTSFVVPGHSRHSLFNDMDYYTKEMPEYCKLVIEAAKKAGFKVKIVKCIQEEI